MDTDQFLLSPGRDKCLREKATFPETKRECGEYAQDSLLR